MGIQSIRQRGRALEDAFYREKDKQLLDQLRADYQQNKQRVALATECGITDESVVDALIENGIQGETLNALNLVPLVAVAWADNQLQSKERQAILSAAQADGIEDQSPSHQLLASWLEEAPSDDLVGAWKSFAGSLAEAVGTDGVEVLKGKVLGRAKSVAEAAGGILGMGNKISAEEQAVLDDLAEAFTRSS